MSGGRNERDGLRLGGGNERGGLMSGGRNERDGLRLGEWSGRGGLHRGLTEQEAARRLLADGRNEIKEAEKKSHVRVFLEQLNDPLIYVLLAAALVSLLMGEISDALIIGVVVVLNAVVGMVQEGKAQRALEELKKLTSPRAVVVRDGVKREIPAAELVVGDLVCLEAGCQVPADLRLTKAVNLKTEESALTGEAMPVEKVADGKFSGNSGGDGKGGARGKRIAIQEEKTAVCEEKTAVQEGKSGVRKGRMAVQKEKIGVREEGIAAGDEIPLGDRRDMAFMSTVVTYGHGEGIVEAVGMRTQIGQIAAMISDAKEELTPLQKRLGDLGKVLSILSVLLCGVLFLLAVWQHRNIMEMLLVAISLAVAAVPEGLPAVVTICLALSVTKMVKVNTIIRKLPSVETLGAVSVVCSDKTGTLTKNRMTVEECYQEGRMMYSVKDGLSVDLLYGMTLCNDAETEGRLGDPTELALLDCAAEYGMDREELECQMPRLSEIPFDSDRKMMTTFHRNGRGMTVSYTKGAPDMVLKKCTFLRTATGVECMTEAHRREIQKAMELMSSKALRTLAIAMHRGAKGPTEEQLTFVGMVGMHDPVRPEAVEAVETFREAGVKTVMITGDHVETAYAIAKTIGIAERPEQCMTGEELQQLNEECLARRLQDDKISVFARVSPAQKVRIVKGFKAAGEIVAMTGDGVNDAPSLKTADIGIAMGRAGTDVAKQASDMILTDDNFATIEKAIEEGRGVYENIRKSVIFLLSSNLGEILTMFLAVMFGLASPLKSSHILWINLITDSLPALALGVDRNDGEALMRHKPRKQGESLFARGGLACTCFYGLLIAGISLIAFLMLPCAILNSAGIKITPENLVWTFQSQSLLAKSQTYAFTVLGMSQLFHAVGMRDVNCSVFRMSHRENKLMIAACAIGLLLQFAVTEVPFLITAFGTSRLSLREWLYLAALAAFPMLAHECIIVVGKMLRRTIAVPPGMSLKYRPVQ